MTYRADPARYDTMQYRRSGHSGLKLPVISLGLWQNFGGTRDYPSAMKSRSYEYSRAWPRTHAW
jgi:L-glyceraldehyde 3-phosphate reductase